MNILDEVMTFSEACQYIGKGPAYFFHLAKTGEIKEGEDYRVAGGSKLILKSVVEKYRYGSRAAAEQQSNIVSMQPVKADTELNSREERLLKYIEKFGAITAFSRAKEEWPSEEALYLDLALLMGKVRNNFECCMIIINELERYKNRRIKID